jgi:hypothetical protein
MTTIKEASEYYQRKSVESMGKSTNSIADTNQTERDLASQIILVATVVIGVTGAILAAGVFNKTATVSQGIAASVAVLFALLAITFGVLYYFALIKFNMEWAKVHRDVSLKLDEAADAIGRMNQSASDKALEEANELVEGQETQSSAWRLYTEIICLAISVVGLFALVLAVVFDWFALTGIRLL